MTPNARHRSGRASGFTLVELLLVLFIIGLVSALVLPRVLGNFSALQMQGAMERVMAACRRARCEACGSGLVHCLNVDVEGGTYWIAVEVDPLSTPGVFERVTESWGRTMELPERIAFGEVTPDVEEAIEIGDAAGADVGIGFFPDGRTTGAIITLQYADPDMADESPVLIRLDAATGRVGIITVEEREAIETEADAGSGGGAP